MGIAVKAHLPGVGENLQDHLQLRLVFKVSNISTLNTQASSLYGKMKIGLEYLLHQTGPMSMSPSQLGAFAYSRVDRPDRVGRPDLQYHVQPLSLEKFGEDLHTFNAFTASVCNIRPTSRGTVHIRSTDILAPPVIQPNYLSTDEDKEVAAASILLTRDIVSSDAFLPYNPVEIKPGSEYIR
jgi:choline dehydrogenase